jgi:hypothetical protein
VYIVLEDFRGLSMSSMCRKGVSSSRPCAETPHLDALAAKGVEPVKSSIETKAARSPRDDNAKQSGRERNRRVSIRITY